LNANELVALINNNSGIISALSATVIAAATIIYTLYSRRTISKFEEQNRISIKAIDTSLKIEENKKEQVKKSLAKHLLFEVQDNNYLIDELKDQIHTNDKGDNPIGIANPDFQDVIYKNYLEHSLTYDFNNENLNPQLRNYYSKISEIKKNVELYNEYIRKHIGKNDDYNFYYVIAFGSLLTIGQLKEDIFEGLIIESDFNIKEKKYYRKYEKPDIKSLSKIIAEGKKLLDK